MNFGSICSGIEAASVAFAPLKWKAAWLSEIEPFPCAVLAHHYPSTPNLGDMTTIAPRILSGHIPAPELLCGGTPCQAFSVAGLRKSLEDDRGNLTLKFVELANAIDDVRVARGDKESVILWENVPGVLSTKDNAFGCFLAGLAGEDEPLQPPGKRWEDAGAVYGPRRAIAWRTLDAQYFGLAQRRRRVFVVASARNGFDPAQVLFEWDGMRRDTAPSREQGQSIAGTLASRTDGGGLPGTDEACSGYIQPVAKTLIAGGHSNNPLDETLLPITAHTLRAEGFDASEDGTGRGTPLVPVAFDTTQITSQTNRSNPQPGDPCHPLAAGAHPPAIAFQAGNLARGAGAPPNTDVFPTLRADHGRGLSDQHPCVAFPANLSGTQCASAEDLAPSLGALNPTGVAYTTKLHNTGSNNAGKIFEERTTCLDANSPPPALLTARQVRRLTPRECERLQGFPDDYTLIPGNKRNWAAEREEMRDYFQRTGQTYTDELLDRLSADGPRYKALGNSWAVPCARWIGKRIEKYILETAA